MRKRKTMTAKFQDFVSHLSIYIVPILIAVFVLEEKMIFFCIGAAENILQEYIRDYNA